MSNLPRGEKLLPRFSMRLAAFRRYEPWIVAACKGSLMVDTQLMSPPMKTGSFILGFQEARRGHELYNYDSAIPRGYNLRNICLHETESGKVWIENKWQDEHNRIALAASLAQASVEGPSLLFHDGKWLALKQKEPVQGVVMLNKPDKIREAFLRLHEDEKASTYTYLYIVEGPPETQKLLDELHSEFGNVTANKEDESHWRLFK